MKCDYYNLENDNRFPLGPLSIDIPALYQSIPIQKNNKARADYVPLYQDAFHRFIYSLTALPLSLRVRLKILLRKAGIDDIWLKYFEKYWIQLGGRPFWHTSDFYFLRNIYRLRQPPPDDNTITDTVSHLAAWQNSEYIYSLFHAVLKETFSSEMRILRLFKSLCPSASSVLEFGCGAAIITSSILAHKCYKQGRTNFVIADLKNLPFHYAGYKFSSCSNVIPVSLLPENNFQLVTEKRFDVVFCCQVFEHLNDPMQTVKTLYEVLDVNGLLFFDYIITKAKGLDTVQGFKYRDKVLDFISDYFEIEHGTIDKSMSMGVTVARKVR